MLIDENLYISLRGAGVSEEKAKAAARTAAEEHFVTPEYLDLRLNQLMADIKFGAKWKFGGLIPRFALVLTVQTVGLVALVKLL